MMALRIWGEDTSSAVTVLMLVALILRAPLRRAIGSRLTYYLWALPALRIAMPPLPTSLLKAMPGHDAASRLSVLVIGGAGPARLAHDHVLMVIDNLLLLTSIAGTLGLFILTGVHHLSFCRRLRCTGTRLGSIGNIQVIATDVEGPLAFGVFRRFIAVPRTFSEVYSLQERHLSLEHEHAHHHRGDLIFNWLSLAILASQWWDPAAWIAIKAFREDQEFAVDAYVVARNGAEALRPYAGVLAKAAGISALPACSLNSRCNLKGRLMMITQEPRSNGRLVLGGIALTLFGSGALAATAPTTASSGSTASNQVLTIGVKPDGLGHYALIVGNTVITPGSPLPRGATLPSDFSGSGGCDLKPTAKPSAMAIKGMGQTQTYTIMCASAEPALVHATLKEGLASLKTMRASVATQHQQSFPEAERSHALAAIDRSIHEVEASLASAS